jgi:hypothetical protein
MCSEAGIDMFDELLSLTTRKESIPRAKAPQLFGETEG